jgi:hypothetical protein
MKYTIQMGSGVMIYIPNFMKTGSGIQKFIGGIQRQHGDLISLLLSFSKYGKYTKKPMQLLCFLIAGPEYI